MNTKSAAAERLLRPSSIAMKIVEAERDVPGKTPATTCARPTAMATFQVTTSRSGSLPAKCSATSIHTPPISNAQATGCSVSGNCQPALRTISPTTAVTRKATPTLST